MVVQKAGCILLNYDKQKIALVCRIFENDVVK